MSEADYGVENVPSASRASPLRFRLMRRIEMDILGGNRRKDATLQFAFPHDELGCCERALVTLR